MSIEQAIENLRNAKLDEMRDNLNKALMEKAVEKLDERKIDIAKSYFGQK